MLVERRYVGLEIASDAVRGVMPHRGSPMIGSVELPPGAVVYGEIIDADAVRDAIRELWASTKFPTKRVVLGLNNQDVVTRVVDMPALDPKDMRSALPFELADLMPFALEDAIIDHQIIEEYESDDGHPRMRVLAVIAVRDSVRTISSVLESAGLTVSHIDVTAMALVRAVATDESDHVHAIIEVGRDTLTIVIHHGSEVHFCRSLVMQESEGEVWAEFQAELQLIEQYRSRGEDAADMPIAASAFASGDQTINGIVGSLEYYALQDGARTLDRISLVGDATRAWAIAPRLSSRLDVEVDLPDPLRSEADDDEMPENRAEFVAAYGLALTPVVTKLNRGRLNLRPLRESVVPVKVMAFRCAIACALTVAALVIS